MSIIAARKSAKKGSKNEQIACETLYNELEKGVLSAKKGEIFTIDEAWEEIDKV